MAKRQILIAINEDDYKKLLKDVKKTKIWLDDGDTRRGDDFCLSTDPEYAEDISAYPIEIVMVLDETT